MNVIGGILHTLVLVHVSLKTLRNKDWMLRRYVRRWLHLQSDTPTAMFHANTVDGGLGIPSMVTQIPRLRRAQLVKMTQSVDPLIKIMVSFVTGEAADLQTGQANSQRDSHKSDMSSDSWHES